MKKEEAVAITLERLAANGNQAEEMYRCASMSPDPERMWGASPRWFYDRMQEYRDAECALRKGDVRPAVALLNSLVQSRHAVGLSEDRFRRGRFPILCLRDGLLGIDTPSLPDLPPPTPSKRTLRDRIFDKILDRILGL